MIRLAALLAVLTLAGCSSNEPAPPPPPPPGGQGQQPRTGIHRFTFKDEAPANREVGAPLPGEDAALTAADGRTVKVSDYRGRPVVLVFNRGFVGYVCPYCSTYTAQLAARYEELRALGAEVLCIYPTRDQDEAKVVEFTDAVNQLLTEDGQDALPFPVFLDRNLEATRRFNLTGDLTKPSTFVLDRAGIVRYAYVGSAPDERPAVERVIAEVRAVAGDGS
jgi:peroxiredoxin